MVLPSLAEIDAELERRGLGRPRKSLTLYSESTLAFKLHSWQSDHLCQLCERFLTEKGLRVAVHGPPQFGKTIIVSQRFLAWLIINNPTIRIGLACYNETRASEFGEIVLSLVAEAGLADKTQSARSWSTKQREALRDGQPSFMAMGLNSGFVGRGVDCLVVDDPYKSAEEAKSEAINGKVKRWWKDTAGVRLDDSANVLVMFHRYHADDLAQALLDEGFEYVRFPAIADENEDGSDPTGRKPGELLSPMRTKAWLAKQQDENPETWLGQFQGRPRPQKGAFFESDWFDYRPDSAPKIDFWVRYWDLATSTKDTADHTCGALVGLDAEYRLWLRDMKRFRAEWPQAQEIIAETAMEDLEMLEGCQYQVGVEQVAFQLAAIQDLFQNAISLKVPIVPVRPKGDKKQRASVWAGRARYGKFALVKGKWNDAFVAEALDFPLGKHDDQIDAVSGAVEVLYLTRGGAEQAEEPISPHDPRYIRRLVELNDMGIDVGPDPDSEDNWDEHQDDDY